MNNLLKRRFNIPGLHWLDTKIKSLSHTGRVTFYIFAFLFGLSALILLLKVNNSFLVEIPRRGGTLTEGVVGLPHFVNPLLAVTDGDKDLVALIYSGLMRQMPDGSLIPDLAQSYTISSDGKTYDFVLKQNATFQDGSKVTADDVVFTINAVQNPAVKSPKATEWNGVTVKKINDYEVSFTLAAPYAPFLENTTLGILPAHLFSNTPDITSSVYNTNPIGSGPYKFKSIEYGQNSIVTAYDLTVFNTFILGNPYISNIKVKFYDTDQNLLSAYQNADIDDINSISPDSAETISQSGGNIIQAALPRVFAVFFNQSANPVLSDKTVRDALAMSVDREYITETVLHGFGIPLNEPVPPAFSHSEGSTDTSWMQSHVDEANALLDKNGWTLNSQGIREKKTKTGTETLSFSISTSDATELTETASILKEEWKAIGADVTIKVVEGGYLNQNVIKPRKYDALLFGEVINRDLDIYAFWHSSQISDPGLNVALYANKNVDKLLESMRIVEDPLLRDEAYKEFQAQIASDTPAVFLYSPNFVYVVSPDLHNVELEQISTPSDRFGAIYNWYNETDRVWKIFTQ